MANKRIYYAIQQVKLGTGDEKVEVHGLQSVGMTTNFNLEQVFELGQLEIYQNVEEVPEIEVTLNKVLDGYPLIYILATEAGTAVGDFLSESPTLTGRQNARVDMELSIYDDAQQSAEDESISVVNCDGMYVSSVSYTFPVDGNFTEDVTLVGNDKIWGETGTEGDGAFAGNDDDPASLQGVGRRQFLDIASCVFPSEIPGVSESGKLTDLSGSGLGLSTHFQNITVSCDLGREAINELGRFAPYHRFVTFPVEVTSEFEVLAITGDEINATEDGYFTTGDTPATTGTPFCDPRYNLRNQRIFLQTCEGTKIYLGRKNKLSSVNYTGGDTGGGNVTVTYSYTTFNDFVVAHSGGPLSSGWYDDVTPTGYIG
jgi:hypothetical protein